MKFVNFLHEVAVLPKAFPHRLQDDGLPRRSNSWPHSFFPASGKERTHSDETPGGTTLPVGRSRDRDNPQEAHEKSAQTLRVRLGVRFLWWQLKCFLCSPLKLGKIFTHLDEHNISDGLKTNHQPVFGAFFAVDFFPYLAFMTLILVVKPWSQTVFFLSPSEFFFSDLIRFVSTEFTVSTWLELITC